jgi:nitrogen fixation protein FixH
MPIGRTYTAMMQFRTTLDQAGRIAGLAGELGIAESDVIRRLIDRALDQVPARQLLRELRADVAAEQARREDLQDRAERGEFDAEGQAARDREGSR